MSILDFILYARTSINGPHYISVLIATSFMAVFVLKKHIGLLETLGLCLGVYYIHESIYEAMFFVSRYLQGTVEPFGLLTHAISLSLVALFFILFWKRLHLSKLILPFVTICVLWFAIGLPISFEVNTPAVNLTEEAYTMSFLAMLWGIFR